LGGISSAMTSLVYKLERDRVTDTVKDTEHINEYSKEKIVVKDTINESNTD
jgi:hypothetical protein